MFTINRSVFCCAVIAALALLLISCSSTQPINKTTDDQNSTVSPDTEGMWLMPQIKQHAYPKMKAQGVKLDADALYHSDSTAMNRAIVRINAGQTHTGTGSFVSDEGLILTNYKAAYQGIAKASNTRSNYLADGFYANSKSDEIPVENYRLYILIEQQDVTGRIENKLGDSLRYRQRQQRSQQIKKELITQRKAGDNTIAVTINDIMGGNRHVMSVYRVIQDVRLVHAPPASAGQVGGHMGSWKWPRHSGDYAFLRAYVGPNGESRSYNENNVPFNPATHLSINKKGVSTGDFTFTMGFPGQTSRHKSSYHLQFYRDHQFPIITQAYRAILDGLQHTAAQDSQAAIENANRRESIANTLQYYQSAQRGFSKHNIIANKQQTEQAFKEWIKQDSLRNNRYRRVLSQLDQSYNIASQTGDLLFANIYTLNNLRLFEITDIYHSYRQIIADSSQQDIRQAYKDSLLNSAPQLTQRYPHRGAANYPFQGC
ncbi:MAG: S46 family peptidase [Fodinibius sp.]|nr:S46 family peptidase [Fodinibius sp.]